MIYGIHSVLEMLKQQPDNIQLLLVQANRHDGRMQKLLQLAKKHHVAVKAVKKQQLDTYASQHQGVVAELKSGAQPVQNLGGGDKAFQTFVEHCCTEQSAPLFLLLDQVTDPHNLGACMRTANAVGVDAIIVPKDGAVGLTPVVRKVACGAAELVPLFQVTNLTRAVDYLKDRQVWVTGLAGEVERSMYDVDFHGPAAIVMGAEGKGMRRLTREHCDDVVHIPMKGDVESLNVSVATAVVLYEALRQRQG